MRKALAGAAVVSLGAALTGLAGVPRAAAETPVCEGTACEFLSPTGAIDCVISVGDQTGVPDSASCGWSDEERAHSAKLLPSGALEPCINLVAKLVDRCESDPEPDPELPRLGYGETAALGPFTCLADAEGITCTAAPSSRGFSINSAGILPIGI